MNIDVGNALYTAAMILLAFVTALIVTKTVGKYISKDEGEEEK